MAFCRDAPLVLAAGGAKGTVAVWDTMTHPAVNAYVQEAAPEVAAASRSEVVAAPAGGGGGRRRGGGGSSGGSSSDSGGESDGDALSE